MTSHAVILAAGEGKRLLPLTRSMPKCLVEVAGKRILENALNGLAAAGCTNVRIVTGHHADLIQETISGQFAGMNVSYIRNDIYQSTNSMYSLALGLTDLDEPAWVLEGDVFFENSLLTLPAPPEIAWFVDSTTTQLNGAYVAADSQGIARSLEIVRDVQRVQPGWSKSAGILKLTRQGLRDFRTWLNEGITNGRQEQYYDLILADHMKDGAIRIVDVAGRKWFEIDTPEDLEFATRMFR